ncbi:MAG: recombination protein F [Pontixanthobacter sp.]
MTNFDIFTNRAFAAISAFALSAIFMAAAIVPATPAGLIA